MTLAEAKEILKKTAKEVTDIEQYKQALALVAGSALKPPT